LVILVVNTASEYGGLALYRQAKTTVAENSHLYCLARIENEGDPNYSVSIFQMAERIQAETAIKLSEIDLFASATGPGSFTGIRVGLAAVQGWAHAFRRPVRGVSVFSALAEAAQSPADWVVPILDARRGDFYVAGIRTHKRSNQQPNSETAIGLNLEQGNTPDIGGNSLSADGSSEEGFLLKQPQIESFLRELHGEVWLLIRHADLTARAAAEQMMECGLAARTHSIDGSLVDPIAAMAANAWREHRLQSAAELDACYVRRSDAELRIGRH
jgi:tRNA threonylcarbamoyl adenosine modification protein YeaZ